MKTTTEIDRQITVVKQAIAWLETDTVKERDLHLTNNAMQAARLQQRLDTELPALRKVLAMLQDARPAALEEERRRAALRGEINRLSAKL